MDRRRLLKAAGLGALAVAAGDAALLWGRSGREPVADGQPTAAPTAGAADPTRAREVAVPQSDRRRRTAASPSPADAGEAPVALTVVCRRDWGAQPPAGAYRGHQLRTLTIHHTAVVARDGDGAARVRSHQAHHLDRGFVDLAYHHLVGRDGTVYEGRPVTAVGETFTDYDPAGHYLPCLEGDFGQQTPTPPQLQALVRLLAWAATTYGIPTTTLAGHREYAATACPGDALQRLVADGSLRQAVDEVVARGAVALAHTCG